MERIVIELTNHKAYGLLKELEELNLIKVIKNPGKPSSLRNMIQTKMTENQIDSQLEQLRNEWKRDIYPGTITI